MEWEEEQGRASIGADILNPVAKEMMLLSLMEVIIGEL